MGFGVRSTLTSADHQGQQTHNGTRKRILEEKKDSSFRCFRGEEDVQSSSMSNDQDLNANKLLRYCDTPLPLATVTVQRYSRAADDERQTCHTRRLWSMTQLLFIMPSTVDQP
jgi:hypothetical protein